MNHRAIVALVATGMLGATIMSGCGGSRSADQAAIRRGTVTEQTPIPAVQRTTVASRPTTTAAPPTTDAPVSCQAMDGDQSVPGGTALVRSPSTDHRRAAVVMLHGYTATTQGEEAATGWTGLLAGTDAVVAYPQGNPTPQGGFGWTTGSARYSTSGTDDVGVIAQLVDWLVHDDCVDPGQVLIAGESNGSAMSLLVACSGRLPVSARLYALAIPAVDPNVTAKCAGAKSFPLMVFAGRLDRTVPYGGTPGDPSALSAPKDWFTTLMPSIDTCTSSTGTTRPVPDGTALTFGDCAAPATFFAIDDGVHTWPGGPGGSGAGGLTPGAFPAAKLAWCASGLTAHPPPVTDCASLLDQYALAPTR